VGDCKITNKQTIAQRGEILMSLNFDRFPHPFPFDGGDLPRRSQVKGDPRIQTDSLIPGSTEVAVPNRRPFR
jgi:hypothetical protein